MAHQSTDQCVWNCLESVRGAPYELSNNTGANQHGQNTTYITHTVPLVIKTTPYKPQSSWSQQEYCLALKLVI